MSLALLLLFGLLVLGWTAVPLLRAEEEPRPLPAEEGARDRLEIRRETLYESIRDLDFEYAMGKLGEADYRASREDLLHEGAGILRELDAVSPSDALERWIDAEVAARRGGPPPGGCPACGRSVPKAARFCDGCGEKLLGRPCAGCGTALRADARFCAGCGKAA